MQGRPVTQTESRLSRFLEEVMRRRRVLPSQLAVRLGVSHATVGRWLSGQDAPSLRSCRRLSEYSGESVTRILDIAGQLPSPVENIALELPDFREYARKKYPIELDEDVITMIEDLIQRRRERSCAPSIPG